MPHTQLCHRSRRDACIEQPVLTRDSRQCMRMAHGGYVQLTSIDQTADCRHGDRLFVCYRQDGAREQRALVPASTQATTRCAHRPNQHLVHARSTSCSPTIGWPRNACTPWNSQFGIMQSCKNLHIHPHCHRSFNAEQHITKSP